MAEYMDIVLNKDGSFCIAPPWSIKEGDLIYLADELTGEGKVREVVAVATDAVDGDHIKLIEKYIGYPLPRITAKYLKSEVAWDEAV